MGKGPRKNPPRETLHWAGLGHVSSCSRVTLSVMERLSDPSYPTPSRCPCNMGKLRSGAWEGLRHRELGMEPDCLQSVPAAGLQGRCGEWQVQLRSVLPEDQR